MYDKNHGEIFELHNYDQTSFAGIIITALKHIRRKTW